MTKIDIAARVEARVVRQFSWDIATIQAHLDQIRQHWASLVGVSVPQWMILAALHDTDVGGGVPVKDVSSKMFVDPSFITTQSKILEGRGLVLRKQSASDGRIILMSLTELARTQFVRLADSREAVQAVLFADFDSHTLEGFMHLVGDVKSKCERASRLVAVSDIVGLSISKP
ncbi:MarR family transcriptional regulator [Tardiphaga sp. P9-11]|uniref:MarR family winged helix-turn-helix transcriptional regulator n=1 Tax=Tardiphaga sp. P9-11 TaxID=2024614 RepID=UPI0011F2CB38|nr:MarR family transcriptional regulator [Tardiphaga sp. P9-11]KAA0069989.1 MarR family transcriptional regulator [Tardiphaga sp. P9-11]